MRYSIIDAAGNEIDHADTIPAAQRLVDALQRRTHQPHTIEPEGNVIDLRDKIDAAHLEGRPVDAT